MANINDPILEAAHRHSFKNREVIQAGGDCGCFFCLKTFDALSVTKWTDDGQTALCPFCGIDSVLSVNVDSIDPSFLRQMHRRFFEQTHKVSQSADKGNAAP
jgi:hypothetical protein